MSFFWAIAPSTGVALLSSEVTDAGMSVTSQCVNVPFVASGSSTSSATLFVLAGTADHRIGGDTFAPSQVYSVGIAWVFVNADDVTSSFAVFASAVAGMSEKKRMMELRMTIDRATDVRERAGTWDALTPAAMKPVIYVVAVAISACAGESHYVYRPETANAVSAGMPAARTPIPQEQPQGAVEVTSYGITELRPGGGARVRALHVRMIVTNDGDDTPWHVNSGQQLVEIPAEGRAAPMYANADVQGLPDVTIARHDRRVLDLYYPLPTTIRGEAKLPRFELLWQVDTSAREVASRTSFDRVEPETELQYETWPLWAGYGPYWWYDPWYPRAAFVHAHPIVVRDHRAPLVGHFDGRFAPGGAHVVRRH